MNKTLPLLLAAAVLAACKVTTGPQSDKMTLSLSDDASKAEFVAAEFTVKAAPGVDFAAWRADLKARMNAVSADKITVGGKYVVDVSKLGLPLPFMLCAPTQFPVEERFGTQAGLRFDGSPDINRLPVNGWTVACFVPPRQLEAGKTTHPAFMFFLSAQQFETAKLLETLRPAAAELLKAHPDRFGGRPEAELLPPPEMTDLPRAMYKRERFAALPGSTGLVFGDFYRYGLATEPPAAGGFGVIYPESRAAEARAFARRFVELVSQQASALAVR